MGTAKTRAISADIIIPRHDQMSDLNIGHQSPLNDNDFGLFPGLEREPFRPSVRRFMQISSRDRFILKDFRYSCAVIRDSHFHDKEKLHLAGTMPELDELFLSGTPDRGGEGRGTIPGTLGVEAPPEKRAPNPVNNR